MSTRVDELAKKGAFERLDSLLGAPFVKSRAAELSRCATHLVFFGQPKLAFKAIQSGADPFMEPHKRGGGGVLASLIHAGDWKEASTFVEQFSSGEHRAAWSQWDRKVSFCAVAAASLRYAQALLYARVFPAGRDLPHDKGFEEACVFFDRLKDTGADIDGADVDGFRALHHAAGYPKTFNDPTCLSICGPQLPRPYASSRLCAKLLSLGADANAPTNTGMKTPLMCAALSLSVESIRILLDAGADVQALDANGNSVAHYAAWGFRMAEQQVRSALLEETLALICSRGAELALPNNAGHCPANFVADDSRSSELGLFCRRSVPAQPEDVSLFGRVAAEQEGQLISDGVSSRVVAKRTARL